MVQIRTLTCVGQAVVCLVLGVGNCFGNFLSNSSFETGSSSVSVTGAGSSSPSAATGWSTFNWTGTTTTEMCGLTCASGFSPGPRDGTSLIHITTSDSDSGIYQFTGPSNSGPLFATGTVWVYIVSGGAQIGMRNHNVSGGSIMDSITPPGTLGWFLLTASTPSSAVPKQSPVNELFIYSSGGASNFFADQAVLAPTAAPEPATMLITAFALFMAVPVYRSWRRK